VVIVAVDHAGNIRDKTEVIARGGPLAKVPPEQNPRGSGIGEQ